MSMIIPEGKTFEMRVIGEHNQVAASLACEVGRQCGLDEESIVGAIKTFSGVSGRLENLGLFQGVTVFNDNNATTEDATIASINAINETYGRKPIVIVGGVDKGLSDTILKLLILELFLKRDSISSSPGQIDNCLCF